MQYVLLASTFGNLNTYYSPDKVGPNGSVTNYNVDLTSGSIKKPLGSNSQTLDVNSVWTTTDTYIPSSSKSIAIWRTGALGFTDVYSIAHFGGRLYRANKGYSTWPAGVTRGIQYTSDTATPPTWDYLGLMTPGTPTFAASGAGSGSVPKGSYTYYCTFYNVLGQESPPTSASVTITSMQDITVTLPKAYTTATFSNGATSITAASTTSLRIGQRITGTGIQSGTYITNISGSTVTISKATTAAHSGSGNNIIDAQIVGTRVYRSGEGVETPLLVQQTANITTTSFNDNKTNTQLGMALTTAATQNMPNNLSDISISPAGVLLFVSSESTVGYMSLVTPAMYNPAQSFSIVGFPLTTIYALSRFIIPTTLGAISVTIDDAILGLPVVDQIDADEPASQNIAGLDAVTHATDTGGEVWWNTNKGILATNGSSIRCVTKDTFSKEGNRFFMNAQGALFYNGDYYILSSGSLYFTEESSGIGIAKYNSQNGWTCIGKTLTTYSSIGFHPTKASLVYADTGVGGVGAKVVLVENEENFRDSASNGYYKTGDWSGDKHSALKKFRKISALFKGSITVYVYIDGSSTATPVAGFSGTNTTSTRTSWWLPSSTKGRTISLKVVLTSSDAEVEELGVWVGEQRELMP